MSTFQFSTRAAEPGDIPFIIDTFARAARDATAIRGMEPADYGPAIRQLGARLLQSADVVCTVATAVDDPDTLLGWRLSLGLTLLFVYVRADFRGNGIARRLVAPHLKSFAFKTPCIRRIPRGWTYRPDVLWTLGDETGRKTPLLTVEQATALLAHGRELQDKLAPRIARMMGPVVE